MVTVKDYSNATPYKTTLYEDDFNRKGSVDVWKSLLGAFGLPETTSEIDVDIFYQSHDVNSVEDDRGDYWSDPHGTTYGG